MTASNYHIVLLICTFASLLLFFFNDTATTEIYTLSLHDALPIFDWTAHRNAPAPLRVVRAGNWRSGLYFLRLDRKSTRLNSSHANISYAVFCLKKKKKKKINKSVK